MTIKAFAIVASLGLVVRVQDLLHLQGLFQQPDSFPVGENRHGAFGGHLAV